MYALHQTGQHSPGSNFIKFLDTFGQQSFHAILPEDRLDQLPDQALSNVCRRLIIFRIDIGDDADGVQIPDCALVKGLMKRIQRKAKITNISSAESLSALQNA